MLLISTIFLHLLLFILKKTSFDFGVDVNFKFFVKIEIIFFLVYIFKNFKKIYYFNKKILTKKLYKELVYNSYLFNLVNKKTIKYFFIPLSLFMILVLGFIKNPFSTKKMIVYLEPLIFYLIFILNLKKIKNLNYLIFLLMVYYFFSNFIQDSFTKIMSLIFMILIVIFIIFDRIKHEKK